MFQVSTQDGPESGWTEFLPEADRSGSAGPRWPVVVAVMLLALFGLSAALNSHRYRLGLTGGGGELLIRRGAFFPMGYRQEAERIWIAPDAAWLEALPGTERGVLEEGMVLWGRRGVEDRIRALLLAVALRRMDGSTAEERLEAIRLLRRAAQDDWDTEVRDLLAKACLSLADLYRSAGRYEDAIQALNTGRSYGLTDVDRRIAELERAMR